METLGPDYYEGLALDYRARRDALHGRLVEAGFRAASPEGAYYILTDFSEISDLPDDEFSFWLTREIGVAPVPGSSFYDDPTDGRHLIRFAFPKTLDMLEEAGARLARVRERAMPG
jgi:aminotransferase